MRTLWAIAAALAVLPTAASASVMILGFERINASYPSASYAQILGFYGGGLSSDGTSGSNFGMTFAPNAVAVCLNKLGGSCSNASRGPGWPTTSRGALGIGSGTSTFVDIPAGYTGPMGFRFLVTAGSLASIEGFSGLGGTGVSVGFLPLFATSTGCPAYNAVLCPLKPGGIGFLNAKSIVFSGLPGHVVFDDLTFGAGNDPLPPPATVPEPASWALMIAGFGMIGGALRRNRLLRAT